MNTMEKWKELCIHHRGVPCIRDAVLERAFREEVRQEAIMEVIDEIPDEVSKSCGLSPTLSIEHIKDQLKTRFL